MLTGPFVSKQAYPVFKVDFKVSSELLKLGPSECVMEGNED